MKTTDTCPRCLRRDVTPRIDAEDYDGNPASSYRCPACGHTWFTHRAAEPEPDYYATYDDPDAWEADDDFSDYDPRPGLTVTEPTGDDIAALRRQGDLSAYLRDLIRPTRHTPPARGDPTTGYGPGHTPGAWPHGTQPPTSLVCQPDCPCAIQPPPT